ncbi:MAG TPA: Type 1 glutamine amidotransferase-like domain-containing protein [Acidimicrobiales bacterium]|nr:Type 1 glutamine amidotransferase-like domain-containing protein [Acidimicrobiales bacterium]
MPGPVALVGSGEYLPVMAEVEAALLAGRPARYVQLPTAAAQEGAGSIARWVSLGAEQAVRLGVEAVPLMVLDRQSADDESLAAQIAGAGLVYLSGGSPSYLVDTLRDTRVWAGIVAEWQRGAALAGCSAGAIALSSWVPDIRRPEAEARAGLGVVPRMRVIPHFDRLRSWRPEMAEAVAARTPSGTVVVGIDEETAVVSDGADLDRWVVHGRQAAWVFTAGERREHRAGDTIVLTR